MLEEFIMQETMGKILEAFAKHFIKKESMSKDEFFEIQKKVLNKIKKKYNIKD